MGRSLRTTVIVATAQIEYSARVKNHWCYHGDQASGRDLTGAWNQRQEGWDLNVIPSADW